MGKGNVIAIAVAAALAIMSGCTEQVRDENLEKVAKDWCMVIRASQVVPVYPLTEDLQVGDVFLVQSTVENQHKQYAERGFLPMDNLISRLYPTGFAAFYERSFSPDEPNLVLPSDWLQAGESVCWVTAPNAAFPTYSFSVKAGGGFNLAVPAQSVPIGLALMRADAVEGTISIRKAKTYGIDTMSLHDDVRTWERANHGFLLNYASTEGKANYVRVISRVYLTGEINVSLLAGRSAAGGASAGAGGGLELLTPKSSKDANDVRAVTLESYSDLVKKLNDSISGALDARKGAGAVMPSGQVRVISVSSRGVSMAESFGRPLAIGYLGFDMAIGPDGVLGPPIPTHAVLTEKLCPSVPQPDRILLAGYARWSQAYDIIQRMAKAGEKSAVVLRDELDKLASILPATYEVPIFDSSLNVQIEAGANPRSKKPVFRDVTTYLSQLGESLRALEKADRSAPQSKQWLEPTREALESTHVALKGHSALLKRMNDYVSSYFEGK